jgi:hypothetical protein
VDSYPGEVDISILTNSNINIFGNHIGEPIYFQDIWVSYMIEGPEFLWFKDSKIKFKRFLLVLDAWDL